MSEILSQIRVLEIAEGIAGPTCALQLADLGAEVIKVEPPEGDRAREWGPPMVGEDAAIFAHLNRGKKSVQLDLQDGAGREVLLSLVDMMDVVIVHMEPEDRAALGIDWDDVVRRHPRLIVCLLTDLGDDGRGAQQ